MKLYCSIVVALQLVSTVAALGQTRLPVDRSDPRISYFEKSRLSFSADPEVPSLDLPVLGLLPGQGNAASQYASTDKPIRTILFDRSGANKGWYGITYDLPGLTISVSADLEIFEPQQPETEQQKGLPDPVQVYPAAKTDAGQTTQTARITIKLFPDIPYKVEVSCKSKESLPLCSSKEELRALASNMSILSIPPVPVDKK